MSPSAFSAETPRVWPDGRPSPRWRLQVRDHGPVLRHGDGPGHCDRLGARDVWTWTHDGTHYLHYDGAGDTGWLACLATSSDLLNWTCHGPVLELGAPGSPDSASASYGVTHFDQGVWHLFYLGTPASSPPPDRVPMFPYLTLKAKGPSPCGPWTKQPDVRPFAPAPGTYYATTASPGHIIRHGDEWLMFFSASVGTGQSEGVVAQRTLGIARTRDLDGAWTVDPEPIVPLEEQIENSVLHFDERSGYWWLFTNHVGLREHEFTDAIWVYWSKDPAKWDVRHKAVVIDGQACSWSKGCIGLPGLIRQGDRLALIYDGVVGNGTGHMARDLGLAWIELPLVPPV